MSVAQKYSIDYKGLMDGEHLFDFKVDDALFEMYDRVDIKSGDCYVHVVLLRSESMLNITLTIKGYVTVECDRCLDDCQVPIEYQGSLIVKFSNEVDESSDEDVMWVSTLASELNLTQYIYESIVLSLPYRRVHPEGECNQDIVSYFTTISEEELEAMDVSEQTEELPSEWNKLADLKKKLEEEEQ